jgi:hypothetical protein
VMHGSNLANNIGGGGGAQNGPWVLGVESRSQIRKRGEDHFESVLNIHTPISPTLTQNFVFTHF